MSAGNRSPGATRTRRRAKPPAAVGRTDRVVAFTRTLAGIEVETPNFGAGLRAAALIREMRKRAGLSQSELGTRIGVTQARISEIEAGGGRQGPSFLVMERIAEACGTGFGLTQDSADFGEGGAGTGTVLMPVSSEPGKGLAPAVAVAPDDEGDDTDAAMHGISGDVDAVATVDVGGRIVAGVMQAGTFSPFVGDISEQTVRIRLKAFDSRVLDQVAGSIEAAAARSGALIRGPIPLPTRSKMFKVATSGTVDPRAAERFEIRTYGRMLDIVRPTPETVEALINLDIAAGVDVDVALGTQIEGIAFNARAGESYRIDERGFAVAKDKPSLRPRRGKKGAEA